MDVFCLFQRMDLFIASSVPHSNVETNVQWGGNLNGYKFDGKL